MMTSEIECRGYIARQIMNARRDGLQVRVGRYSVVARAANDWARLVGRVAARAADIQRVRKIVGNSDTIRRCEQHCDDALAITDAMQYMFVGLQFRVDMKRAESHLLIVRDLLNALMEAQS